MFFLWLARRKAGQICRSSTIQCLRYGLILLTRFRNTRDDTGRFAKLWLTPGDCAFLAQRFCLTEADILFEFYNIVCSVHSPNYEFLQDVGKTLDWSLMSPGQLHAQTPADQKKSFKSFTETAPISVPSFFLNIPLLRLFGSLFVLPQMMKFNATYENVADLMVKGLQSNGPFKNKRVGLVPSN